MRYSLLGRIAGGDPLARLLPAVKAVVPGWSQPIGQNRESLPARFTESAPHPDAFVLVIVALASAPSMANDRVAVTNWTTPRQALQRNHPGSMLSSASGSAMKRITAGVKAAADRSLPSFDLRTGLHPPGKVSLERKQNTAFQGSPRAPLARDIGRLFCVLAARPWRPALPHGPVTGVYSATGRTAKNNPDCDSDEFTYDKA